MFRDYFYPKMKVASIILLTTLCAMFALIQGVKAEEYVIYFPNKAYPNVRSCGYTPGNGVWMEPVLNTIGVYIDWLDHGEIGVLEITETCPVCRVEVYGSGCVYPVALTCNGVTKEVNYYHDYDPYGRYGYETLIFDIIPSNIVTLYTTPHLDSENHGFGIKWIKLYYVALQLTVSISPTSASILVGQSITFMSTVSGGYPPYTYQWYLNNAPVSGATSPSWTFTPTTAGIYYVHLKIIDAKGNTARSEAARITVATVPVGGHSIPIQPSTETRPVAPSQY